MKKFAIFLILPLCFILVQTKGQSYSITSLDGVKINICLSIKDSSDTLTIACSTDTIHINNFWALDTVEVVGNAFLKVNYARRGGSNEGYRDFVLVCASHAKLFQALNIESYANYDMRPHEYSLDTVYATLKGHDKYTYQLLLHIHREYYKEKHPGDGYDYHQSKMLAFDKRLNVFYSRYTKDREPVVSCRERNVLLYEGGVVDKI